MAKYDVIPVEVNGDYVWEVLELNTQQVIESFFFEEDAIEFAEEMENRAFEGWTPSFILKKIEIVDDINQKFSTVFQA
jgi:hypothetical protein